MIAATGGSHGGGTRLTPYGRWAVAVFRQLQDRLHESAALLLPRLAGKAEESSVHVAAAISLEEVLGQLLADYAFRQPAVRVRTVFGALRRAGRAHPGRMPRPTSSSRPTHARWSAWKRRGWWSRIRAGCWPRTAWPPSDRPVERLLFAVPPIWAGSTPHGLPWRRPPVRWEITRAYLESLGLYERLLPHAVVVDNSRAVVAAIRAGRADVGLVYGSDADHATDCRLLFRVRRSPAPIQHLAAVLPRRAARPGPRVARLSHVARRDGAVSLVRVQARATCRGLKRPLHVAINGAPLFAPLPLP